MIQQLRIFCVAILGVITATSAAAQDNFFDWTQQARTPVINQNLHPNNPPTFAASENLQAQVVRTQHGVPHIKAGSLQELGFGVGLAYSQDNFCILADQIVKVNSQRSLFFGPGEESENIISDFGYLALEVKERAEQVLAQMSENSRALISGYVRGVNHYLEQTGVGNLAPECANAPWVQPITEQEILANYLSITLLKSGENFKAAYLAAQPPLPGNQQRQDNVIPHLKSTIPHLLGTELGSNGWAIGRELSENGKGVLFSNPHFANSGNLRFYEMHLTIPGYMNSAGVGIATFPLVQIGFNENLGWTHTVSVPSSQFVIYKLRLVEGDPSKYVFQNSQGELEVRPITSKTYEIQIGAGGEAVQSMQHTVFKSHFGLMVSIPPARMEWTDAVAFTLQDANFYNYDFIDHWLGLNLARNLEEFQQPFKDYDGLSWVNTMYADKQGNAYFVDGSSVPNLRPEALDLLETNEELKTLRERTGIVLLPGESHIFEWQSTRRGLIPYENKPKLLRDDFVQNSNDSYWLTNPQDPIRDVSSMYGPVDKPQRPRTRMSLRMLEDAAGPDGKFNAMEVWNNLYSNRGYQSEQYLTEVVERCERHPTKRIRVRGFWPLPFGIVSIGGACQALAGWDGLYNNDSQGAHVFREMLTNFKRNIYEVPFDPEHPVTTPRGLKDRDIWGRDPVLLALARGTEQLQMANIAMDASLGDIQFLQLVDENGVELGDTLPKHGGYEVEGAFNIMGFGSLDNGTRLPRKSYEYMNGTAGLVENVGYPVGTGTSFAFSLEFTERGPRAIGILTYSQSTANDSPFFKDQDEMYAQKGFRTLHFQEEDIVDNAISPPQMFISQ